MGSGRYGGLSAELKFGNSNRARDQKGNGTEVYRCEGGPGAHMATTISILGGVGLFLLGMTVMTAGLKTLAGSALRTVLARAAATPLSGAFWGALATLVVQSSSATTMTTIG